VIQIVLQYATTTFGKSFTFFLKTHQFYSLVFIQQKIKTMVLQVLTWSRTFRQFNLKFSQIGNNSNVYEQMNDKLTLLYPENKIVLSNKKKLLLNNMVKSVKQHV
jgi:hypothetical protein